MIKTAETAVGAIRIVASIAQKVLVRIEEVYPDAKLWELDTILQEEGNCYLYEKLGYLRRGETKEINDKMTIVFYEKHQ